MSHAVAENERAEGSLIMDTSILRPGDYLRYEGIGFAAMLGVLDSHDPQLEYDMFQVMLLKVPAMHHHVLVQVEGEDEILSAGLKFGNDWPDALFFGHVTYAQREQDGYTDRLLDLLDRFRLGSNGLFYVSDREPLGASEQGRNYIGPDGKLLTGLDDDEN